LDSESEPMLNFEVSYGRLSVEKSWERDFFYFFFFESHRIFVAAVVLKRKETFNTFFF